MAVLVVLSFPIVIMFPCVLCHAHPQEYTGRGLQQKVDAKQVDTTAIQALMRQQDFNQPATETAVALSHGWIAGPVIGGVAGAAILVATIWWLYKRKNTPQAVPAAESNAVGTDAAVRVRRVADKYAVQGATEEAASSDGGTPHSTTAQVCHVL